MVFVLCARCHDSHDVLGVYSSRGRAEAMAAIGNWIEVRNTTSQYIALARAAKTADEREHWVREMLHVRPDGVTRWFLYVQEVRQA